MDASAWFAIFMLAIVANTIITILLYPSQKPNYWWLPGAWIWFKFRDLIWVPLYTWMYPATDPNIRKHFAPPRIA